jgi:hypothetical protein
MNENLSDPKPELTPELQFLKTCIDAVTEYLNRQEKFFAELDNSEWGDK